MFCFPCFAIFCFFSIPLCFLLLKKKKQAKRKFLQGFVLFSLFCDLLFLLNSPLLSSFKKEKASKKKILAEICFVFLVLRFFVYSQSPFAFFFQKRKSKQKENSCKNDFIASPIDCGNLFVFTGRRGRRPLRVLQEFYCSSARPLFQKNGVRSFF